VCWGDITKAESIERSLDQVDIVVHMAAILPPLAIQLPELAERVNVGGTKTLIEAIKQRKDRTPVIYTSSVAVFGPTPDASEALSPDRNEPHPVDSYGETKLQAENVIKESGLDFVILRLTATPYLTASVTDLKRMYDIPPNNRVEFCHPDNIALAIGNSVKSFTDVNGRTLIISGGSSQRMLYKDMMGGILAVLGLPLPPEKRFAREPYPLDWYDTCESEGLLNYQRHTYTDYLNDFSRQLSRRYGRPLIPLMRHVVGPLFGKAIFRFI
jgi:UDP-glucose 4-epimerase